MGPLSFGTAVGNGARGLQRVRRCMELLQPRSGALASLSVGRGRVSGNFRRRPAALFRAGALEWTGPDSKGAPVRTYQQRRKPRRGRKGILLLLGLHADPLLHEISVQV